MAWHPAQGFVFVCQHTAWRHLGTLCLPTPSQCRDREREKTVGGGTGGGGGKGVVGWRLGEATGRKKGLNGIKKMAEEEYGRGETHPRLRVEGAL